MEAAGLPVGMFCDEEFSVSEFNLESGQTIVIYTDGVSEATSLSGEEYGAGRLRDVIRENHALPPAALVSACREALNAFRGGAPVRDDVTILALRRAAS